MGADWGFLSGLWACTELNLAVQVPWSSQFGEDAWLDAHLLHGKRGGFYLEMGALDGVKLSNSRWFYQAARWRGVLIEACPSEH